MRGMGAAADNVEDVEEAGRLLVMAEVGDNDVGTYQMCQ